MGIYNLEICEIGIFTWIFWGLVKEEGNIWKKAKQL
jgi:hypothetical protein